MKVILDTNVFISGVFYSGAPNQILNAWRDGKIQLVISHDILREYLRVGEIFADKFPSIELQPILDLVTIEAELHVAEDLSERVCSDPDDDKFLACAIASGSKIIVSGDKHLVKVSGFHGIEILKPHEFIKRHL
ncbi:MAG TPA: putative toxin-antitoxin system toxin component, PIN family [Smithellaceae bacterium]|nr:putative toxin-antitoxin system toxin component, PIN family [Smithellaceae bacterium]HOU55566.1 putative toxin-antitoxin system toxin component, PIN family [Smithellaceae bacterium]HPL32779.1 putative toxin-antitoxin system toxin component, PIN family [Smithellaceae bacterium]HQH01077.1 putative toxin-antitoxin system toxin component, PIN family [Smithellaceae bacterium]HQH06104.1 putative toxin-antitoxin system toxin component, PIN family [Smithellaceae bacterium]